MARQIISADTLSKTKTKSNKSKIDLEKVKDFVVENRDTIETVVQVAGSLLNNKTTTKRTSRKTKSNKTTRKSTKNNDGLSKMMDIASTFLKK